MERYLKITLLLAAVCIHLASSVLHVENFRGSSGRRVKRAWAYQEIMTLEGDLYPVPRKLSAIKSDLASSDMIVHYGLTGDGVGTKFAIDSASGNIQQIAYLDRETKDRYNLTASAYDVDNNKIETDSELIITVLDVNDNLPIFVETSLFGSVPETNDADSPSFMTVEANDIDLNDNGKEGIRYTILSDKKDGAHFEIDPVSGKVTVVQELDYETQPLVYFVVQARDSKGLGVPVTATATIEVLDSNDHAPVIMKAPPKSISELFPLGMVLYTVTATDEDKGINEQVFFNIEGKAATTFEIISHPGTDKSTGDIKLIKELNFESGVTQYSLEVVAYNKLASNANDLKATSTVVINVEDANEPPQFQDTPYTAVISEAADAPVELSFKIWAKDFDFGGNQSVTYSISDDPENWFEMDLVNEKVKLKTTSKLDREAPSVKNGIYTVKVSGTDNYPKTPASTNGIVQIFIEDINDNPPVPVPPGKDDTWVVYACDKPNNSTIAVLEASDPDDATVDNGPPFTFRFEPPMKNWHFDEVSPTSSVVVTMITDFDATSYELPFIVSDSGSPTKTSTSTLTVSICSCSDGDIDCAAVIPVIGAGFPVAVIIAIIVVLLLVIILVLAAIAYKRKRDAQVLKEPFFDDEDDIRENIQVYHEEGGEEDQDAYDLSALRAPLLEDPNAPIRIEKPLQQAPQTRVPRGAIPDDIGDYIGDAKDQADSDPSAPPFDSLLVFDYEGQGSDAGSLSSINTATTDGSIDYDYLNDWGPRFKRLADMYNAGSESE